MKSSPASESRPGVRPRSPPSTASNPTPMATPSDLFRGLSGQRGRSGAAVLDPVQLPHRQGRRTGCPGLASPASTRSCVAPTRVSRLNVCDLRRGRPDPSHSAMTTDSGDYPASGSATTSTTSTLPIASLTRGIVGIATSIVFALVGVAVGVVAIVLGVRGRPRPASRGSATGGIATGAVAVVLGIVNSILGSRCSPAALAFGLG